MEVGNVPKISGNKFHGIFVLEREHAAASVFDKQDLLRPQQLLRDDDASKSIHCHGASISDHMGVSELDAESSRRVDTSIHTSQDEIFLPRR